MIQNPLNIEHLLRKRRGLTRELLADKRALLLWGMRDPLFGIHALDHWKNLFHDESAIRFDLHGRHLLEENPWPVIDEMRWFLMNYQSRLTEGRAR